jgi:nucleotidyltransferase/DNA polymerase involved in DNA repair
VLRQRLGDWSEYRLLRPDGDRGQVMTRAMNRLLALAFIERVGELPSGYPTRVLEFDWRIEPLIEKVWRHCESTGNRGRTVTLKVKFSDFEIITRSRSVSSAMSSSIWRMTMRCS